MQDTEIAARVWTESGRRLKNFIARRVGRPDEAEDILQDVFYKIQRHVGELEDASKLYPWIFQLTRRAIVDHYRAKKHPEADSEKILAALAAEPAAGGVEEEVAAWLRPMIEELPAKYRDALLLADLEGLTQQKLAARLGVSLSGAKARVRRGRAKLRALLLACCRLEFDRAGRIVEYRQKASECRACAH